MIGAIAAERGVLLIRSDLKSITSDGRSPESRKRSRSQQHLCERGVINMNEIEKGVPGSDESDGCRGKPAGEKSEEE